MFNDDLPVKLVLQVFLVISAIKACLALCRLLARRPAEPWAVVLAGGDGDRVSAITRDAERAVVPKQYWS